MTLPLANFWKTGRRMSVMLAAFIALILAGNGLIILQFRHARAETERLTGVSQQLIAALRLQETLLSFHQRLNDLVQFRNVQLLLAEEPRLRTALLDQTRETRRALAYLPPDFRVDPAFLTALDTIEVTLPAQLRDVAGLAAAGDWVMVRLHLDYELARIETTAAALVKSIDRDLDRDLPRVVLAMRDVHSRILFIVPVTALSTVLIAALFGWGIARRIMELRVEERVAERTRIARELHDTLLQSFQGVLLKFAAVQFALPDRPAEAAKALEAAIEEARHAIIEGRDAVQDLRASAFGADDLARAIHSLGAGLAAGAGGRAPDFGVRVDGKPRQLPPGARGEIYRIAGEALRNAFRHAEATRIEVAVCYEARYLRLHVRDNGRGIDPDVLRQGGRLGHHGLPGMQERCRILGGELEIRSETGAGAVVELTVPLPATRSAPLPDDRSLSAEGTG